MTRWTGFMLALLAAAPALADPPNPLDALRVEILSATRDRPLFAPSRRPPPPPRAEAAPPPPPPIEKAAAVLGPPPFDLVGSVIGQRESFALLLNKSTNQIVRVRLGQESDGWRVTSIRTRSVALVQDGRTEALALAGPPSAPAGAQVAGEPQPAEITEAPEGEIRHGGRLRPDR